ncbi:MAG TPA: helix-turn-helix domain-containing protein [Pseudonocardia sp.]|nr:helix-turn-helix domain-containing protein [Pseudonocardia sp.]
MAGTYQQFCAVAAALDAVGDRWTLLVVRELLAGPRRYGELVDGLPGVATNLLAERLRRLEAAGLVAQEPGPDARTRVYRLTERGAELDAVVTALARFGISLLPDDADGLAFRADWLAIAVRLLLRPGALDADLVVRFDVPGSAGPESLQLRLGPAGATVDPDGAADVVLTGDPAALVTAVREPARTRALAGEGRLTVTGSAADRVRLAGAFGGHSADVVHLQ